MIGGLPYNVVGFDPSLSHSVAHHHFSNPNGDACAQSFTIKSKPDDFIHHVARLDRIARMFSNTLILCEVNKGPGLFVVEGYSYGSLGKRENLAEWGGQIRRIAFERGWRILVVPPTTLKKYVTGKGVAEKDMMMMHVLKRWGYTATDNNDADAYSLAQLGIDFLRNERGLKVSLAITAEIFKVTPAKPKTDGKKAQKQKGLVAMEPSRFVIKDSAQ